MKPIRKRCIDCAWIDASRDIAPTAICCKYNHEPILNAGRFNNCYGYEYDTWIDDGKDIAGIDYPYWMLKHSVNCIECGQIFDEREGNTPEDGEGTLCPECGGKTK